MGKYQAYPDYKDSDIDWLDAIPEHWITSKLRYTFSFGKGLTITKENLKDTGIPCVSYGEVHSKYGFEIDPLRHPLKCVDEEYIQSSSYALLKNGDIVFADTSEDIDGSGNFTQLVSDELVFAGYHTIIARPFDRECSRFYAYLLDSKELRTQVRHAVKGVKVFSITQAILRGVNIWRPPIEERAQIANFLDHETAKIDTLIDKQQQLIKLLKEKRQAVISHAVTKGLNLDVPMKESGVEWLGEVPEHWRPKSIKRLFKQRKQQNNVGYEVLSVYREFGVILKSSRSDNHNKTPDDLSSYQLVNKGCLVINKMKAWQGSLGVSDLEGITSPDYVVYESIHSESDKFLHFLLRRQEMPNVYRAISNGIRPSQWRIEPEKFEDLVLFLPSLEEQLEVVKAIEKEVLVYEQLISKCASATKLMEERKSALISAAVTGKIDVRNWRGNKLAYKDEYSDAV
ncbi:restriction endonuclease subunit S [Vibrio tasmaniensis ZS-17]|uniref:restriction endonuclease subunit S n=1 Tax=Vibrio tasmaniensis TaxID=212663 RepID=UPI0002F16769|nr:restriction endonuclease subunit S [Vibrio tasmaniensis]OED66716.1 restriction endonuclease subunit S [Vibrio tasmaniensis ZS-17]